MDLLLFLLFLLLLMVVVYLYFPFILPYIRQCAAFRCCCWCFVNNYVIVVVLLVWCGGGGYSFTRHDSHISQTVHTTGITGCMMLIGVFPDLHFFYPGCGDGACVFRPADPLWSALSQCRGGAGLGNPATLIALLLLLLPGILSSLLSSLIIIIISSLCLLAFRQYIA